MTSLIHFPMSDAVLTTVSAATAAATLNTGVIANNNAITWTAVPTGYAGNGISVVLLIAGNNTPLTVAVSGQQVLVNVATGAGGAATSTATQVMAAVAGLPAAAALVTGANNGASTGAGIVVAASGTLTGGTTPGLADMRGWDAVAFLLFSSGSTVNLQMSDSPTMSNPVAVTNADTAVQLSMQSGAAVPYYIEAYRPTKSFVQATSAPNGTVIFRYRHTGLMPPPPPARSVGRAS